MKWVLGFIGVVALLSSLDQGLGYTLKAAVSVLPSVAIGLAVVFAIQRGLRMLYCSVSSSTEAWGPFIGFAISISIIAGLAAGLYSLMSIEAFVDYIYSDLASAFWIGFNVLGITWISSRYGRGLNAKLQSDAKVTASIEKKKASIIRMIDKAIADEGPQLQGRLLYATDGGGDTSVIVNKTSDDEWQEIRYQDLPKWIKQRADELDSNHLEGWKYEYRRTADGDYQRRLRSDDDKE